MKSAKNFVFAVLFVAVFAVTTPAGDQNTPGYVPPPPVKAVSSDGDEITIGNYSNEPAGGVTAETSDYLIYEALAVLLSSVY